MVQGWKIINQITENVNTQITLKNTKDNVLSTYWAIEYEKAGDEGETQVLLYPWYIFNQSVFVAAPCHFRKYPESTHVVSIWLCVCCLLSSYFIIYCWFFHRLIFDHMYIGVLNTLAFYVYLFYIIQFILFLWPQHDHSYHSMTKRIEFCGCQAK